MIDKVEAFIIRAQEYTKLIVSIIGGLAIIGAQFIPADYVPIVTAVIAALTAFSVYQFPNITPADAE